MTADSTAPTHSSPDQEIPPPACRPGCAACCIAPSISSPIPGMVSVLGGLPGAAPSALGISPVLGAKPAGVPCPQLAVDLSCRLFGRLERPAVCASLAPSREMCGADRDAALTYLRELERLTAPG